MINKIMHKIGKIIFNNYFIFATLLVLFKPLLFFYYPVINRLFNIAMIISGVIILTYYILNVIKTRKISQLQISILILIAIFSLSTLLFSHDFGTLFKVYGRWFIINIYCELLITKHEDKFLRILSILCLLLIIGQFLSVILFPQGIINANPEFNIYIYLLGNDNTTTITLLLGALFILFYANYSNNQIYKKLAAISIVLVSLTFALTWCATGVVGVIMLLVFYLFIYNRKNDYSKFLNLRTYLIVALILFLVIVIFRLQDMFGFFIEGVLHKDLTFSWRTLIWDNCLHYIRHYPLIGIGVQDFAVRLAAINIYHAHCTFLQVLLEGGVLGFLAFLNIFRIVWKKLNQCPSYKGAGIIAFGIFIYFITGLVEVFQDSQMLYIFLVLGYYSPLLYKEHKK